MTETDLCDIVAADSFDADADLVFEALAPAERRVVLARLLDRRERATESHDRVALADLAVELAAWKRDTGTGDVEDAAVESAHAKLYHVHVPKLADAGVVSHDREDGSVALTAPESVRECVDLPTATA
ncbi:DUF7344 domain-containing protein [Halosimplex sp. J119]